MSKTTPIDEQTQHCVLWIRLQINPKHMKGVPNRPHAGETFDSRSVSHDRMLAAQCSQLAIIKDRVASRKDVLKGPWRGTMAQLVSVREVHHATSERKHC